MNDSSNSANGELATYKSNINIGKYDTFYSDVHKKMDLMRKFKLNTELNQKEKVNLFF